MTTKKYEILRDQTLEHERRTLYRIRRLCDGLIGGWIEKEENLSQVRECFVYNNAKVYGNAKVFDNAKVYGNAMAFHRAKVCGNAEVFDNARVCDETNVYENARVFGHAHVCGKAVATVDVIFKRMPIHDITDFVSPRQKRKENETLLLYSWLCHQLILVPQRDDPQGRMGRLVPIALDP